MREALTEQAGAAARHRNSKREAASERMFGTARRTKASKGQNPKSGFGMEQAREAMGGAKHREGEKPWGCNTTGRVGNRRSYVAPCCGETLKGKKPWEGARCGLADTCIKRLGHRAVVYW